jgi:MinD-like ATPase involved in chromosome partitioning or flagellar assembly
MPWLAPDDVLTAAVATIVRANPLGRRVALVRDVRGRVRVAVERGASSAGKVDACALSGMLQAELGGWFAPPVLDGDGSAALRRIADEMFRQVGEPPNDWPQGWPTEYELLDGTRAPKPAWLVGRAILNSKESWFTAGGSPPSKPHVVAFYSFKGGVGRTTTLACVAARIAARPQRVLAIDLDLEAPGLGSLFDCQSAIGVVDHLLSHIATGEVGDVHPEPANGVDNLWILTAGRLGPTYLEKLARLDFLADDFGAKGSPTEEALRALIDTAAAKVAPDIVLLDSRAGLHDIGGLALHRLSHMDVLVTRANQQTHVGMQVVMEAIRRMHPVERRDLRIVQTMVKPPFDAADTKAIVESWRKKMYDLALQTIYVDLEEVPQLDDQEAHYPLLVAEREELQRLDRLQQISTALLAEFDGIAEIVAPREED